MSLQARVRDILQQIAKARGYGSHMGAGITGGARRRVHRKRGGSDDAMYGGARRRAPVRRVARCAVGSRKKCVKKRGGLLRMGNVMGGVLVGAARSKCVKNKKSKAKSKAKPSEWVKFVKHIYDKNKASGMTYREAMKEASEHWRAA